MTWQSFTCKHFDRFSCRALNAQRNVWRGPKRNAAYSVEKDLLRFSDYYADISKRTQSLGSNAVPLVVRVV